MGQRIYRPTFIDVFAGCGGLSLGLVNSNWKGLFAIERSPDAFKTFKANFLDSSIRKQNFDWPSWLPQKNMDVSYLLNNYRSELIKLRDRVDLMAGGPPCQGFSFAGKRSRDDPRNKLVEKYLELVEIVQPRIVLIENVSGIATGYGRGGKKTRGNLTCGESAADSIIAALGHDYHVFLDRLNANDFGVPQNRERYFFIGIRRAPNQDEKVLNPFDLIKKNRGKFLEDKNLSIDKPVSVGQAISDLVNKNNRIMGDIEFPRFKRIWYVPRGRLSNYQKLMRGNLNGSQPCSLRLANHKVQTISRFQKIRTHCKPGRTLSDAGKEKLGIKKNSIRVLSKDLPSGTITTLPDDQLHYSENRILTVREQARLQSFPDWFVFEGKYTTGGNQRRVECPRYTQIGNAVPPFVSEAIGRALKRLA